MSTVVAHSVAARTSRTGAGRGPFAARLRVMLLFAVITILGPACAAGGSESERSISPLSEGGGRSSLLLEALTRSVVATYGRTAVVSRQPRDRFLREIVERAGVLEDARSAGLPLDLLVDSYVATAGAGSAGGVELLDAGDESVARSLAALLAGGDTPSHRCAAAEAPLAGERGWLLTCTAVEPSGTQLFIAVVPTGGTVIVAQETGPRVDHVAATLVRELRDARRGK